LLSTWKKLTFSCQFCVSTLNSLYSDTAVLHYVASEHRRIILKSKVTEVPTDRHDRYKHPVRILSRVINETALLIDMQLTPITPVFTQHRLHK